MATLKRVIASVLLASMIGCTTLRPVADYQQYVRTAQPSQLWLTPLDSPPIRLEAPRFVNDTLVGFVRGHYREFAPGDVRQVQVRQSATGRTMILVGAAVAVGALLLSMLASGGPDSYIPTPEDPPTTNFPLP